MTIAEQLARAKTDLDDVYEAGYNKGLTDAPPSGDYQDGFEAGKQAEYNAFWDAFQDYGNRTNYNYGFSGNGWTEENFRPKYDMNVTQAIGMFYLNSINGDLVHLCDEMGVKLDFSNNTKFSSFAALSPITKFGELDCTNVTINEFTSSFYACANLHTIDKLILNNIGSQTFANTFTQCTALANITFEGVIGQSVAFAQSNLLTVASMDSIYAALKDYTSNPGVYTLTLHASAWARWNDAKPDIVSQYGSMKNYVTTTKGWATS